jgi:hypothetical protein
LKTSRREVLLIRLFQDGDSGEQDSGMLKGDSSCAAEQVATIRFEHERALQAVKPRQCQDFVRPGVCVALGVRLPRQLLTQCRPLGGAAARDGPQLSSLLTQCTQHDLGPGGELVVAARDEPERAHTQRQIPDEHRQDPRLEAGLDGLLGQKSHHPVAPLKQASDHW